MPADKADQLFGQGNLLYRDQDLAGAAECYRRALEIEPEFAAASFNLGCTLEALAGPAEALPHYQNAVALRPDWCEAHSNLGFALARVGRMAEAAAELEAAAALKPEAAGIRNNLGLALSELGRGEEAYASFREAIRLDPLYPEAHNNLASLFERYGRTSEAISSCLEALRLKPDYPEAHNNLGCALKSQGRHAEAVAHFREALRLKPDYHEARSSLLFALCYPADIPEDEVVAEHLAFGAAHRFPALSHHNDPDPDRVLRIGYVSADFRAHAVARFIEPVLRHHDRSRFQIFCYSNVAVPDDQSVVIGGLADSFVNIAGVSDEAACAMIREDRIDILIDLSGHSAGNRLPLFARKPAPIQVTWLGYPHTTGVDAIDYRITDAVTDPPGASDRDYAEKLLRLPGNFSCFAPPAEAPEVGPLPMLSSGVITFGSFNNPAKITTETVALWAGVLLRVPNSRLLVKGYSLADPGSRERLSALFAGHGIAPQRLELLGNTASYREHLALYGRVDIALDTFPYHGTTTTCEALWMGVPVVTLAGATHRSRVGASLLGSVGLEALVAQNPQGYLEAAVALAGDMGRLGSLRKTLRQTMASSPLTDGAGFTRDLEAMLREVWRHWCAEADPSMKSTNHPAPYLPPPLEGRGQGAGERSTTSACGSFTHPPGPLPSRAGEPVEIGRQFLREGKLDLALKSFLAALRSDPTRSSALGGIEETLNRQTTGDLAAAVSREVARLGPASLGPRNANNSPPPEGGRSGGGNTGALSDDRPYSPSLTLPLRGRGSKDILDGTLEDAAELLFSVNFVTPADLICHYLLDRGHRTPRLSRTMGQIALSIGASAVAAVHFRDAITLGDDSLATRISLVKVEEAARLKPQLGKKERFLLIKAWGYGFWSDVNHVLGQLLLAEMTGRIPVVHWGGNSLFNDDRFGNAFESFFEPVSRFTLEDLAAAGSSFYPPKWNAANIAHDRINQADGPWSRCSALHVLERSEDVVVSDFHYAVNDLVPWIPPGHRLHGLSTDEVYQELFQRCLRVKPWIAAKVESFYRQRMAGSVHLALHVRGGDKGGEDPNLAQLNALYHPEIARYLQQSPQARLFLMTDDQEILASYLSRYGERIIHTGATRTDSAQGVHYQNHPSRYRLAEEVIVDTLLATRCNGFIGNGLSNVSCAVAQMKAWTPGTLRLLGARLDRLRQATLYRR